MTNKNKNTNRADERERVKAMYNDAEKAVYIAIRARHEKSGLKFLSELQNAQSNDRTARNNADICNQIDDMEQELTAYREEMEDLRKLKTMCDRQAVSVKNSDEIRKAWAKQSDTVADRIAVIKNAVKVLVNQIATLYDALNINLSDRADLVQTALLQMLQNARTPAPISKTVLAFYGVDDADDLTDTERTDAQNTANFRAVINAVGRGISDIATPEALNRTTTKSEKITPEEATAWAKTYGGTGADVKVSANRKRTRASDCYITVEERHTKKKDGYYKITHYKTVAPYQYIEDFSPTDENGENDVMYIKSYNPFINDYGDIERMDDLAKNKNLTDRQRLFLEYFARACRISSDFQYCKNYAFSRIGVTTETNKTTFFNRLKKSLNK